MRKVLVLLLAAMLSPLCGCNADRASYSAADAAAAAAAAGDAAAAAGGGNAAALRQMGVDHLANEYVGGKVELPQANYSTRGPASEEQKQAAAEQAMLAYEHDIEIRLDAAGIAPKVQALRQACETRKYGACLVLEISQSGGRYPQASLRVRAEPRAIELLIAEAGKGGDVGDRSTHAEDLAVAVRDNTLLRDRLQKQHARLLEFQGRSDLKVADVIALSEQLSRVESELEAAEREGAVHKRRIETQLLSIRFSPHVGEAGRSDTLATGQPKHRSTGGTVVEAVNHTSSWSAGRY